MIKCYSKSLKSHKGRVRRQFLSLRQSPCSGHSFRCARHRPEPRRMRAFPPIYPNHEHRPEAHFGPFFVSLGRLSPTQPNHGHFGTDVGSSIIQRVGGPRRGSVLKNLRSGEVNTDRTGRFSVSASGRTADLSWGGFDRLVVTPVRTSESDHRCCGAEGRDGHPRLPLRNARLPGARDRRGDP